METDVMASKSGTVAPLFGTKMQDDIVEITLLLPAWRAEALVDLSRRRRQSVGQILRGLIDRALNDED
jgi:hypothetical protein